MATTDVVAAVIRREGRYLICKRPVQKAHGGMWEFPGGKVLSGESIAHALQRELEEELGFTNILVGTELFQASEIGSAFLIRFITVETEELPQLLEHDELAWVDVGELGNFALAPVDAAFALTLQNKINVGG